MSQRSHGNGMASAMRRVFFDDANRSLTVLHQSAGSGPAEWAFTFDEMSQAPYTESNVNKNSITTMTVTRKNRKPLVVPDRVRREAGFKNGDQVEFKVSRGAVTILPKPPVMDSNDTLTPDEARIVRRGEAQLKRGKSKPWRVVKHALER